MQPPQWREASFIGNLPKAFISQKPRRWEGTYPSFPAWNGRISVGCPVRPSIPFDGATQLSSVLASLSCGRVSHCCDAFRTGRCAGAGTLSCQRDGRGDFRYGGIGPYFDRSRNCFAFCRFEKSGNGRAKNSKVKCQAEENVWGDSPVRFFISGHCSRGFRRNSLDLKSTPGHILTGKQC